MSKRRHMQTQASPAMKGNQRDAAGRRDAKIIAAARVISIDYRSIVDNAVCGLADNTPDARREVYAQARKIVKRHLQLMRLPEPIVELEQLERKFALRGCAEGCDRHSGCLAPGLGPA